MSEKRFSHNELEDLACKWLENKGYSTEKEFWVKEKNIRLDVVGYTGGRVGYMVKRLRAVIECGNTDAIRVLKLSRMFPVVGVMDWNGEILLVRDVRINDLKDKIAEIENESYEIKKGVQHCIDIIKNSLLPNQHVGEWTQDSLAYLIELLETVITRPDYLTEGFRQFKDENQLSSIYHVWFKCSYPAYMRRLEKMGEKMLAGMVDDDDIY